MSQDENAENHPSSGGKEVTNYNEFLEQKVGLARASLGDGKFLTSEQVEEKMRTKKAPYMTAATGKQSVVTLKTSKSDKHWIYVLEAFESGNSTQYVICFDDDETLKGIVIVGEWEFSAFFRLAERVSEKLKQATGQQKSVTVSLTWDEAAPMKFKAEKEWNSEKWKVVLSCPDPSQCWRAWNSTSGSPRNFILYLEWNELVSLFNRLNEIPEMEAEDCGSIEQIDDWVDVVSLDGLEDLPRRILSSKRRWETQLGFKRRY